MAVLDSRIKYTLANFILDKDGFVLYILFGGARMNKISYAIKIDHSVVNRVKKFCLEHGLKLGFFVEKALREQLTREEFTEDLLDFKSLRSQENAAVSFEEYLKKRAD